MHKIFLILIEGRMIIITIMLFALIIAAWKAPNWVKEIGILSLVTGVLIQLMGLYHALAVLQQAGDISPEVLFAGIKLSFIPPIYGLSIYALSILIRIFLKKKK